MEKENIYRVLGRIWRRKTYTGSWDAYGEAKHIQGLATHMEKENIYRVLGRIWRRKTYTGSWDAYGQGKHIQGLGTHMEKENIYRVLVAKPEGKRKPGRLRC